MQQRLVWSAHFLLFSVFLRGTLSALPPRSINAGVNNDLGFGEPGCWDSSHKIPEVHRATAPRPKDVEALANAYLADDQSSPPKLLRFAMENQFPASEVDFTCPYAKQHITARAGVVMQRDHREEKGLEFMFHIAEAIRWIQTICSARSGYMGGGVNINDNMQVAIYGRKLRGIGEEDLSAFGNQTEEADDAHDDAVAFDEDWLGWRDIEGGNGASAVALPKPDAVSK